MTPKELLTLGQASCLVLGIPPTTKNRQESRTYFNNSRLAVTYIHGSDPMDPIATGKVLKDQNPFKYRDYPESLPRSREPSPETANVEDSCDTSSVNSCEEKFNKQNVLNKLKSIFHREKPANGELFFYDFITMDMIRDTVKKRFEAPSSLSQLQQWVGQDGWLGQSTQIKINTKNIRGRWGYILKDEYQEFNKAHDKQNLKKYRKHIKATVANITTIGYARKSCGDEPMDARLKLLKIMVKKLKQRGRCSKIYVSPGCNADQLLSDRDVDCELDMKQQVNVKGTMKDLIERFKTNYKKVRLVVIDYAGLSTNFEDIQKFIRKHTQIVEIVVDTGNDFDIMSRHNILNNDDLANKFNCRVAAIRRSL